MSDSKKTLSDVRAELRRLAEENPEAFRRAVASQIEAMDVALIRQWEKVGRARLERMGFKPLTAAPEQGDSLPLGGCTVMPNGEHLWSFGAPCTCICGARWPEQRDATADAVRRELARFDRPSLDLNPTPHDEVVPSGVRLPPTPAAMLVGEAVSITIEYRPDVGWWYRVTFSPERDWSGVALSMEDAARRAHEVVCREMKIQASSK